MDKLWYAFEPGRADGDRTMKDLLGGKGANLAEMCALGIPVPPGFTLPTTMCVAYFRDAGGRLDEAMLGAIDEGVAHIEAALGGPRLGDAEQPLLVSVRSGARSSMPGMMDTVLNIGLTSSTVEGLARASGNRRFALDSRRRLITMYGDVVRGLDRHRLEAPLDRLKRARGLRFDSELGEPELERLIADMLEIYRGLAGEDFPEDARAQLVAAVAAVFRSWHNRRADTYRRLHGIPADWGTAANVQAMVFGNFGDTSGTGVAFTRDPSTGARAVLGEWLPNAQGEDVVAGIRTPGPLSEAKANEGSPVPSLERSLPEVYRELHAVFERLERHYRDVQDIEFTIQEGRLFLLQTRTAKRTAQAALRAALDMVDEGLIDPRTALARVTPEQLEQLMHPRLDPDAPRTLLAKGLPASPGAASGKIALTADEAEARASRGEAVILVRKETSPEDIHGMHAAQGVLTATGGMTSHAAVVARGMGRTCVAGCTALEVDEAGVTVRTASGPRRLGPDEAITIDGSSGAIYLGIVPTVEAVMSEGFGRLLAWADEHRGLGVRANADTPEDAANAVRLGAEGIGLCRTEHMFFAPERILAVREMILADEVEARRVALAKLEPMQRADFVGIFEAMAGRPVTIRFLDPPLHEFLPHGAEELAALAEELGVPQDKLRKRVQALSEFNPMLGHRGCRLGLSYPEVYAMQARAVLHAALDVAGRGGAVAPEIMIPLVMHPEELARTRAQVLEVAEGVFAERGARVPFLVGTMIELPRAALVADEIAGAADFFSFGTNDLTQTTLGLSRDDSGRFLPEYVEAGILPADPFASIDVRGVGELVRTGVRLGRGARPGLKVGVCGEHGGDPASIRFFASVGLDYVSCSPFRVPIARLASARAAIEA